MSLFNNFKGISRNEGITEKTWMDYKMESFDASDAVQKREEKSFALLKTATKREDGFVPLEICGNKGGKQKGAEEIIREAQEKAVRLEQEGYEKGFSQGEKDGFEFGEKQSKKIVENLEKFFDEIGNLKHEILKQYEKEILSLIFAVAEKIVHHEVRSEVSTVKDVIFHALETAMEKNKVIFNVNPEDYDYVEKIKPELFNKYKEIKSIIVTPDPSVSKGGCFLETPYGDIDATLESQMEKICESLQKYLNFE